MGAVWVQVLQISIIVDQVINAGQRLLLGWDKDWSCCVGIQVHSVHRVHTSLELVIRQMWKELHLRGRINQLNLTTAFKFPSYRLISHNLVQNWGHLDAYILKSKLI